MGQRGITRQEVTELFRGMKAFGVSDIRVKVREDAKRGLVFTLVGGDEKSVLYSRELSDILRELGVRTNLKGVNSRSVYNIVKGDLRKRVEDILYREINESYDGAYKLGLGFGVGKDLGVSFKDHLFIMDRVDFEIYSSRKSVDYSSLNIKDEALEEFMIRYDKRYEAYMRVDKDNTLFVNKLIEKGVYDYVINEIVSIGNDSIGGVNEVALNIEMLLKGKYSRGNYKGRVTQAIREVLSTGVSSDEVADSLRLITGILRKYLKDLMIFGKFVKHIDEFTQEYYLYN